MKNNLKKVVALLLAFVLCTAMLTACGGKKEDAPKTPEEVKGTTFDAGEFSVLVPDGWLAFPVSDMFDDYEGEYDPTAVQICKGAESEFDLFTHPYLQINYYPDNTMTVSKDWYDNVEDIEPMELGSYTWNGFTCTSLDYKTAVLYTEGDVQIQITCTLENGDYKFSIDDVDVQALLASIEIK